MHRRDQRYNGRFDSRQADSYGHDRHCHPRIG